MANKSLEIKTATIEIKVVRVDGHKMTKATFRQIQHDTDDKLSISDLLGWVSDDSVFVVWGNDGKIKKRNIYNWEYGGYNLTGTKTFRGSASNDYPKDKDREFVAFVKANCDQLFIAT